MSNFMDRVQTTLEVYHNLSGQLPYFQKTQQCCIYSTCHVLGVLHFEMKLEAKTLSYTSAWQFGLSSNLMLQVNGLTIFVTISRNRLRPHPVQPLPSKVVWNQCFFFLQSIRSCPRPLSAILARIIFLL